MAEQTTSHDLDLVFKALGDPLRRKLLRLLSNPQYFCKTSQEALQGICVQDLTQYLSVPQSTVSRHLAILSHAGLVTHSRWHYYGVNATSIHAAINWLNALDAQPTSPTATIDPHEDWLAESLQNPPGDLEDWSK
ncbi:MAG: ArsR family transcriptional regulator [Sulfobacillus benefaciens]|uniref:ArsR family transcriptional regulator n=1 Tax=Sulfobacillus benefaciens TaxID=453960 RepID=A0A2T2XHE9_9FIRM|nr:MAG: ArsR family transcriptional regulator [Sulfobacillus benefaciens]